MAARLSDLLEGLDSTLLPLQMRVNKGKGLEPVVPYEKLYQTLHDYTNILGLIVKDVDTRLKALEQKAGTRAR